MSFVPAKCQNCGGLLQVDAREKSAICPYCNTPYLIQDAINNYVTHIDNLHADVVNVNSDTSAKARLDAAEAFMKLNKFSDALKAFTEVCQLTPQDYHGWWGQVRAISKGFTVRFETEQELNKLYSLYNSALVFVPADEKDTIAQQFFAYYQPLVDHHAQTCTVLQQKIQLLEDNRSQLQSSIDELSQQKYPKPGYSSSASWYFSAFLFIVGVAFAFINKGVGLFIVSWIPLSVCAVRDGFIAPVRESKIESSQKAANEEIEKMTAQRNQIEQELDKVTQQLDSLHRNCN